MTIMSVSDCKKRISYTSENSPLLVVNVPAKGNVQVYFYNTIMSRKMAKNSNVLGVFHKDSDLSVLGNKA